MLWAEHLALANDAALSGLSRYLAHQYQQPEEITKAMQVWQYLQEQLGDPQRGLLLMVERAKDNLRRYKAKQPLIGHLLPYLTAEEATQQGLNFREEHGWLEEP
jgi:hypothetical protein